MEVRQIAERGRDRAAQIVVLEMQSPDPTGVVGVHAEPLVQRRAGLPVRAVRPVRAVGRVVERLQGRPVRCRARLSRRADREGRLERGGRQHRDRPCRGPPAGPVRHRDARFVLLVPVVHQLTPPTALPHRGLSPARPPYVFAVAYRPMKKSAARSRGVRPVPERHRRQASARHADHRLAAHVHDHVVRPDVGRPGLDAAHAAPAAHLHQLPRGQRPRHRAGRDRPQGLDPRQLSALAQQRQQPVLRRGRRRLAPLQPARPLLDGRATERRQRP